MTNYQICNHCIMDTTDPEITFDEQGVCNHCRTFGMIAAQHWFPGPEGNTKLKAIVDRIKKDCADNEYDCIIGLSGGVDSSYLAYQASQLGLRMLAVHVDGGWNSELAVKNIEIICEKLGIDLYTHVVNWEEMKDLQVAFLKSGVANQDVPQDHAFFAALYNYAVKNNIRYVLSGSNLATEGILPLSWGYDAMDLRHLESIHNMFGRIELKTFPKVNFFKRYIYYPYIRRMEVVKPLNYIPYDKDQAIKVLEKELGWRYYGAKHYESRFTKFFQAYYLPQRFGYDKRKAHFSSLIVSGQMTRVEALKEMEKQLYPPEQLREDKEFVIRKLGLSEVEFESLLQAPLKSFLDYDSDYRLRLVLSRIKQRLKGIL